MFLFWRTTPLFILIALAIPQLAFATTCGAGTDIGGGQCRVFLTSGTTWTVPSDWSSTNTIETVGGGGGGGAIIRLGAGGGGAYAKVSNVALTAGTTIGINVGAGGGVGSDGGDTYLCSTATNCGSIAGIAVVVGARGGKTTNNWPGGVGGAATGVGIIQYSGGDGGAGASGGGFGGPGGGGAAGPNGAGGTGVNYIYGTGGSADAGFGGAGGSGGGAGGPGAEWGSYGAGGGGSGSIATRSGSTPAGVGGNFGGGGGGPSTNATVAAAGGPGIIVITYTPAPPACTAVYGDHTITVSTPGTCTLTLPTSFATLTARVYGAGGGGGGGGPAFMGTRGQTGGTGGSTSFNSTVIAYGGGGGTGAFGAGAAPDGAPGTGSGGDTIVTGGGAVGGAGSRLYGSAGAGGYGGSSTKTYTTGQLSTQAIVVVGGGGTGGAPGTNSLGWGSPGANGSAVITWTDSTPTCSVQFDQNPLPYGGSTVMHWSSSNATRVFIANYGDVTPNTDSQTTLQNQTTTKDFSCTAEGPTGTITTPATLTVTAPASCTFNGAPVAHGNSVTAYQASSAPSCTSERRTCNNGTLSGTYQFASCQQTSCTLDGVTVSNGSSRSFYSLTTAPAGSSCAVYSQLRTCTNGVLSGSNTYNHASCSCTSSYYCSGTAIQRRMTDCSVSFVQMCSAPSYCSAGSSSCVNPTPIITKSLTAFPALVRSGDHTKLSWDISNVDSCSVSGNGQTWTGLSGSAVDAGAIRQQAIFTLTCTPLTGGSFTPQTATVNVLPIFQEL